MTHGHPGRPDAAHRSAAARGFRPEERELPRGGPLRDPVQDGLLRQYSPEDTDLPAHGPRTSGRAAGGAGPGLSGRVGGGGKATAPRGRSQPPPAHPYVRTCALARAGTVVR